MSCHVMSCHVMPFRLLYSTFLPTLTPTLTLTLNLPLILTLTLSLTYSYSYSHSSTRTQSDDDDEGAFSACQCLDTIGGVLDAVQERGDTMAQLEVLVMPLLQKYVTTRTYTSSN